MAGNDYLQAGPEVHEWADQVIERHERLAAWVASGLTPPQLPTTTTLGDVHADLVTLLHSDDPDARLDALGRVLPYVARGDDLAFLLGFVAP